MVDLLKIGLNVDIRRSDGRVHSAVISGLNHETESVTVEWFERGETKGKEVDWASIIHMNPELEDSTNQVVTRSNEITDSKTKNDRRQTMQQPTSNTKPPTNNNIPVRDNNRTNVRETKPLSNGYATEETNVMLPPVREREVATRNGPSPSNTVSNGAAKTLTTTAAAAAAAAADKRKSNVVREIEQMKAKREERRAQQEEARRNKQEAMNLDPGNPNWEFLNMIREFQDQLDYRPLRSQDAVEEHQITVCVRRRPLNKKEVGRKEIEVITIPTRDHLIVHEPKQKVDLTKYLENQTFRFDYAFDEEVNNEVVYKFTAQPLVKTIFERGMATCFAYGQTGSGKTHTMGGDFHGKTQDCTKGIYAFAARDVFKLQNKSYRHLNLQIGCSFFEIYSGKLFDLLNSKAKLRVLEDGKQQVQVVGLTEVPVENEDAVLKLIAKGNDQRTAGQTSANNHSSRSHAVFQIILRETKTRKLFGKFSLIDLAGNERGADTSSSNRQTRMEGAEINKSLLALKECIRALGRKNAHLPFRASKLTLVLRDSFMGENSRTCMIAMVSPGLNSYEHTLNTCRYADRVKELGADPDAALKGSGDNDDRYDFNRPGSPNQSESDVALLQSLNEEDMNDEMLKYQMGVDHMQEQEDRVIELHRKICDDAPHWLRKDQKLLKVTDIVDYDPDDYATSLNKLIDEKMTRLLELKEMVNTFRQDMNQEEMISQTLKQRPRK